MVSLQHAGRTLTDDLVAFDVRWEGELAGATVTWTMVVSEGASEVRLCLERGADGATAQYVLDGETGRRQDVAVDADLDDDGVTARFPADVVGVAVEWPVWVAVLAVDGHEVGHHAAAG
jgi:hypothetical protein